MRLIFIPGFGEDETIFSKIVPFIEGEKVVLNSWTLAGDEPREDINALVLARKVVATYTVTSNDIIIGHSMGGWIAYHIKHIAGCRIVHIASMTSTDRIISPVANIGLLYWTVKKGLIFNLILKRLSVFIYYRNKPSKEIFEQIVDALIEGNKNNVNNQLKVILKRIPEKITVTPDLRIHSKKDTILKPPKEEYQEVPGDHFTLYTHPEAVALHIVSYLKQFEH